ncbi:MAG: hypothetical protein U0Y82_12075 [Thermoleophilia bacterium]
MTNRALLSAGVLAAGAALVSASSAAAVTPVLSCVATRPGGLTAYFGYSNPTAADVLLPIGATNRFTPAPSDRGQKTLFAPDTPLQPGFSSTFEHMDFAVDFNGSITWNLDGKTVTASAATPRCNFDLSVEIAPDRAQARPGEDVVWTLLVRNTGTTPVPRDAIVFSTTGLPPLTFAGDPPSDLMPGEALQFKGITRATADQCGATISGKGEVTLGPGLIDTPESSLANNAATGSVVVSCVSDLSLTAATDATTYSPGQTALYTLTVTNTGDVAVPTNAVSVTDPTLSGLSAVGLQPVMLAPQAKLTFVGSRAITADQCATGAANNASVGFSTAAIVDANPANNTAVHPVTVAGGACSLVTGQNPPVSTLQNQTTLRVATGGTPRAVVGRAGTYTITVRNTGANTATGVVVRGYAPSGAVLAGTPEGSQVLNGKPLWRLGDLAPGSSQTLSMSLRFGASVRGSRMTSAIAGAQNAPTVRSAFSVRVVAAPVRRPHVTGNPTTPTPPRRTPVTG